MECENVNQLSVAYLDGEVTTKEREEVEAHLATCHRCREELEASGTAQRKFRQAIEVLTEEVTPSSKAWARMHQMIEAETQPRILSLADSKIKRALEGLRGIFPRQPVWKISAVTMIAMAVIVGLAVGIPALTGETPAALAAEIAQNDPQVREALGDKTKATVLMADVVDGRGNVLFGGGESALVKASVDLNLREVIKVERLEGLSMPQLTEGERTEAIRIAQDAPMLRDLLLKGADIGKIFAPFATQEMMVTQSEIKFTPSANIAALEVKENGKIWLIYLDLDKETVERILELQSWLPPIRELLKQL